MAFSWAGDLSGANPVVRRVQVAADCYQGQLLIWDLNAGGLVEPITVGGAGPDATSQVAGICSAVVTSPSYDSTYRGDKATYDVTQAALEANDPVGPTTVDMILVTPTTLIKAPIVRTTIGTSLLRQACTTGSNDGLTFIVPTIDTSVSDFSTAYCYDGANRGQYRKVTTGAVATQTFVIPFTYDIAVGDKFVVANVREGYAHIDFDSQFQGINGIDSLSSSWWAAYVHEINLEEAGKEYAVFQLSTRHLL